MIAASAAEVLDEHSCEAVAFEDLYFGQNVASAFAVGHARGVLMLLAGERAIPCFSYTPQQVKSAVCGSGRAAKDQVARMVAAMLSLPEPPTPDHAADALAVAICHSNGAPLREATPAAAGRVRSSACCAARSCRVAPITSCCCVGALAIAPPYRPRRCAVCPRLATRPRCTPP